MKRSLVRIISLIFLLFLILFLLCSYLLELNFWHNTTQKDLWNHPQMDELQVGDIILRSAYGKESRLIEWVSGSHYSHIAVITDMTPEILVTHATTNEDDRYPDQVQTTPITQFLSPTITKRYQIVRPHFLSNQAQQQFATYLKAQQGQPYRLKNREESNLYCTTLLVQALQTLYPLPELQWQTLSIPGYQGDYLFPDAFLALPDMETLLQDDQWRPYN